MDKVRIQLRHEDRVDCRYAEGSREGVSNRRNGASNGVEMGLNGTQWSIRDTVNSTL